jgi:cysteine desulfurase/selenocysteine lyase
MAAVYPDLAGKVVLVTGGEVLRASAYVYNDVGEVEDFFTALDEIVSWMGAEGARA